MAEDRDLPVSGIVERIIKERYYVEDFAGVKMPYRPIIKFANATIQDDPDNDTLIITVDMG